MSEIRIAMLEFLQHKITKGAVRSQTQKLFESHVRLLLSQLGYTIGETKGESLIKFSDSKLLKPWYAPREGLLACKSAMVHPTDATLLLMRLKRTGLKSALFATSAHFIKPTLDILRGKEVYCWDADYLFFQSLKVSRLRSLDRGGEIGTNVKGLSYIVGAYNEKKSLILFYDNPYEVLKLEKVKRVFDKIKAKARAEIHSYSGIDGEVFSGVSGLSSNITIGPEDVFDYSVSAPSIVMTHSVLLRR